jgi:hypothetical protein
MVTFIENLSSVLRCPIAEQITTAVTGPPPKTYDFKTHTTGGSRSPHGSSAIVLF